MSITAQEINKLRQMTGSGMMDCKKALTEAQGVLNKAVEILRKKGQKVSASREKRETNEGVVLVKTNKQNTLGMVLAFSCETDFVARNKEFITLGEQLAIAAFTHQPATVEALKALTDGGISFGDKIVDLVGKLGEKLDIMTYESLEGEVVVPYVHAGSKLGVLVALKNAGGKDVLEAGKDVGMQIAAMSPLAVDKNDISAELVGKEKEIAIAQAQKEGKPENMVEKIVLGKVNKFYKENTLLSQAFVKDGNMDVAKYLNTVSEGLTVAAFKRVSIG